LFCGLDKLDEDESDKCMIEIMDESKKCQYERCWEMMTKMAQAKYFNTHQILWLLLGDKVSKILRFGSFFFYVTNIT